MDQALTFIRISFVGELFGPLTMNTYTSTQHAAHYFEAFHLSKIKTLDFRERKSFMN